MDKMEKLVKDAEKKRDWILKSSVPSDMKVVETGIITDVYSFLELDIVNLMNQNERFKNRGEAIRACINMLSHKCAYSIVDIPDWWDVPERNDFPDWNHIGNHVPVGKMYWNWFKYHHPNDILEFGDSPDFGGTIDSHRFAGDIGDVSICTFIEAMMSLVRGDLWISLKGRGKNRNRYPDGSRHIVLEVLADELYIADNLPALC